MPDISVELRQNGDLFDSTVTDANGYFIFQGLEIIEAYEVRPASVGRLCNPSSQLAFPRRFNTPAPDVIFTCTQISGGKRADFDGDGKADISVFRPANGTWHWLERSTGGTYRSVQWGAAGDLIVAGDYDGDGKTDQAIFRPSSNTWWILQSSNGANLATQFRLAGDVPVAEDYDGDDRTDIAVWRPSNGTWYVLQSSNGQVRQLQWGSAGDIPAPSRYDSDKKADFVLFRPGNAT